MSTPLQRLGWRKRQRFSPKIFAALRLAFLFLPNIGWGQGGSLVILGQIEGLTWTSHVIEQETMILEGVFRRPGWDLFGEENSIRVSPSGQFRIEKKISGLTPHVDIMVTGPKGEIESETVGIMMDSPPPAKASHPPKQLTKHPPAVSESRTRFLSVGTGYGATTYVQDGFNSNSDSHLSLNLASTLTVIRRLSAGLEAAYSALTIGNNHPGFAVIYLDLWGKVSLQIPAEIRGVHFNLFPSAKIFYSSMFVTANAFGYQNMTGEGVGLDGELEVSHANSVHVRLSLILLNETATGFPSHLGQVEAGFRHRLTSVHSLDIALRYLDLLASTSGLERSSKYLNLSYRLDF